MKVNTLWGEEDLPIKSKKCIACGEEKSLTEYTMRNHTKSKQGETINTCKACKRKENKLIEQYKVQIPISTLPSDYRCPGCDLTEEEIKSRGGWKHHIAKKVRTIWRLDHCHETGKFRGYICDYCNNALGRAKDNIKTLKNLIRYLEKHGVAEE